MNVIETAGLGKCYGKAWALRDCTLAIPEGRLAALVGLDQERAVPQVGTVSQQITGDRRGEDRHQNALARGGR